MAKGLSTLHCDKQLSRGFPITGIGPKPNVPQPANKNMQLKSEFPQAQDLHHSFRSYPCLHLPGLSSDPQKLRTCGYSETQPLNSWILTWKTPERLQLGKIVVSNFISVLKKPAMFQMVPLSETSIPRNRRQLVFRRHPQKTPLKLSSSLGFSPQSHGSKPIKSAFFELEAANPWGSWLPYQISFV